MTSNQPNQIAHGQDSLDLLLDRGLSNRLTIVLGPCSTVRDKALSEWLERRPFEVLQVECPTDGSECPRVIIDSFIEAGIVDDVPGDHSTEESCQARLIRLINKLSALHSDLVVVLLNYRQRDTTNRMLSFLLEHLPQQVHIYVSCDDTPDLNCIPRLRVRRQFQTIDTGGE